MTKMQGIAYFCADATRQGTRSSVIQFVMAQRGKSLKTNESSHARNDDELDGIEQSFRVRLGMSTTLSFEIETETPT